MTSYLKQLLEEEELEVPVSKDSGKEPAKMETDELPADPAPPSAADVNMQDSKPEAPAAENGVPESGDVPVQMETDAKVNLQCFYWIMHFNDSCNSLPVLVHLSVREYLLFSSEYLA